MKLVHVGKDDWCRTATMSHVRIVHQRTDDRTARARTDVVLVIVAVVTVALYAAMFLGLYRWLHYDPILPPDSSNISG